MRFVIQVVSGASVEVEQKLVSKIDQGLLVLVGVGRDDDRDIADKMIRKFVGMRIFPDDNGRTNLSIKDIGGAVILVSQFTLYADCRRGNRPSFINAGEPQKAEELYEYIIDEVKKSGIPVGTGVFGADMKVSLVNEGPFTIVLDSDDLNLSAKTERN